MIAASATSGANATTGTVLEVVLRTGVAGCFIGHGAFGIITKAAWVPYFAVGGVSEPWAWRLMPWIGAMDITIGLLALLRPSRALFAWAAVWTVWTALLRPLAGEPFWEALERAGNYGMPLAALALVGLHGPWFTRLSADAPVPDGAARTRLAWTLRLTTCTLLAGHAGLGLFAHKAMLARHYAALGIADPAALVPRIGLVEFLLAALVLMRPRPGLLFAICFWKIASEALFLIAGAPVWELIERFGSYTAPLALALLLTRPRPVAPAGSVFAT
jgi:hypothetical protein